MLSERKTRCSSSGLLYIFHSLYTFSGPTEMDLCHRSKGLEVICRKPRDSTCGTYPPISKMRNWPLVGMHGYLRTKCPASGLWTSPVQPEQNQQNQQNHGATELTTDWFGLTWADPRLTKPHLAEPQVREQNQDQLRSDRPRLYTFTLGLRKCVYVAYKSYQVVHAHWA